MKYYDQILQDVKTSMAVRANGGNMIIGYLGIPGIGKTQMIEQAAQELGITFFGDMVLSSCSPMDIMGKVPNMEDEVLATLPNDDLPLEYRVENETRLFFIDEVTNATTDTAKALQQGLLSRKFGKHRLGKNVIIVLAGNRQSDKAGSGILSTAMYNRVTWRNFDWDSSKSDDALAYLTAKYKADEPEAVETLALLNGYFAHKPIIEKDFTDALGKLGKEPFVQWTSPRSLEALIQRVSVMGWKLPSIVDMAGDLGMGRATELAGFASLLGKLDRFEKVVAEPQNARIPDSVEAKYAMASVLALRGTENEFGAIWEYMGRFEEVTMRIVYLKLALKAHPAIARTREFSKVWTQDKTLVDAVLGA